MKKSYLDDHGIAHYILPALLVVAVVIIGTFSVVVKANHHKSDSVTLTNAKSSTAKTTVSQSTAAASTASPVAAASPASSATATSVQPVTTTPAKTPSTPKATTTPTAPSTASSSTTVTPAAPAQTPLSTLTAIIANVDNGIGANVTAANVTVPGPISNAQARPIVFGLNGQTYFAYTQEQAPNFNTSPSQTAGSMAIVNATVSNPSLTSANLDKAGNFIDSNFKLVGYSTGGN